MRLSPGLVHGLNEQRIGVKCSIYAALKAGSRVHGSAQPNLISHCQFESEPATCYSSFYSSSFTLSSPLLPPSSPCSQIDILVTDVAVVVHSNLPCRVYLVGAGPLSEWLSLLLTKTVNL